MKNDSCMQSRMGMGVTANMEVVEGTYKELMSVKVIRHVLNLTPDRLGRWGHDGIGSGSWVWVASASLRWLEIEFLP